MKESIMPPQTLKDLKESIEHWKRIETGTNACCEGIWADDCALCGRFLFDKPESEKCVGCPIFAKTGKTHCEGSPWQKVDSLYTTSTHGSPEYFKAAKEMREFLESLLPK